ncbi:MAG: class I SAM-dependent rRNA methyltransferase [Bacteroidia bacterium]|nr:class I SAM-dependent rRNA methyltransferase [Bacteroidia bacterium]
MPPLNYPIVQLKKGKEKSLLQRHPWVFSGAIAHEPSNLAEGAIVQVISADKQYLATGHFHKGTITVRCFDFTGEPANTELFRKKIRQAVALRQSIALPSVNTNCYRLLHGEGDGMPGLIIDIYFNTAVIQTYTIGMHQLKEQLVSALRAEIPQLEAIYDKSMDTMQKHGTHISGDEYLYKSEGYTPPEAVIENGIRYSIDFINGQKTGFFLDQRDNRYLLRQYSNEKKVLNTFCYTGGFSLAALLGGASLVHSVDSSKKAIEGVEENIKINAFPGNHQSYAMDVMTFLKQSEEQYDVIILDPPAYAKHLSQTGNAMIGYRNLNTEGIKRIKPGGILFTFSCSQAIDKELFRKLIFQSALQAKREVKILHQLSQPADHPVSIYHPEAEYLKGLVLFVE